MSHDPPLYCSFCGKSEREVRQIVAGPGVFICNECIVVCVDCCLGNVLTNANAKAAGGLPAVNADSASSPQGAE